MDIEKELLQRKVDLYEEALRTISSITSFEVPLEEAGPFLFKVCSQMRKTAKMALEDSGKIAGNFDKNLPVLPHILLETATNEERDE